MNKEQQGYKRDRDTKGLLKTKTTDCRRRGRVSGGEGVNTGDISKWLSLLCSDL